jgi:C4-dicarboxylate transporter/malic acid transport protein
MSERHLVKHFAPGWFATVMGTGGLANVLLAWEASLPGGRAAGLAVAAVAAVLFLLLLGPWLLRWAAHRPYVERDLAHPVTGNFFVTMPVAVAILGTNVHLAWSDFLPPALAFQLVLAAWLVAVAGVTLFTFQVTFRLIAADDAPAPALTNFSWIMAPIANMAVLLVGNPLLSRSLEQAPGWSLTIFVVDTALLGVGFLLFVFIAGVVFVRLAQHPLPPAETTPTFGILLSAAGLAVSALLDTGAAARSLGLLADAGALTIGAVALWGFGVWIVGIILLVTVHQARRAGVPFSLGWWAWVFPLAAYTLASQKVARAFPLGLTTGWAALLSAGLAALWLTIFVRTVQGAVRGTLFTGKPLVAAVRAGEADATPPAQDQQAGAGARR